MRYFIASDIHGSALYCGKMLKAFKEEGCDRLLLLGDILYHGPRNDLPEGYEPKKVIEMLNNVKDRILCVRGNCEAEVDQMVLKFPVMASYAIISIESGEKSFMVYATHGHEYNRDNLPPVCPGDWIIHGHTHIPCDDMTDTGIRILNPGSVSIPKNGSSRGYMILDTVKAKIERKEL